MPPRNALAAPPAQAPIIVGGHPRTGEEADKRGAVLQAANNYGISADVLWEIYGAESSFGQAGNWFGLVAVPRSGSFAGDANAAARTLRKLLDTSHGSYERALRSYSGGGYGVDHLADVAKSDPGKIAFPKTHGKYDTDPLPNDKFKTPLVEQIPGVGPVVQGAQAVGDAASATADAVSAVWQTLTAPKTWLRVLEFIGGLLLGYFALRQLGGAAGA